MQSIFRMLRWQGEREAQEPDLVTRSLPTLTRQAATPSSRVYPLEHPTADTNIRRWSTCRRVAHQASSILTEVELTGHRQRVLRLETQQEALPTTTSTITMTRNPRNVGG